MNKLKRILFTLCLVIFVTNCEIKMKDEVVAQDLPPARYYYEETTVEGMKYGVFIPFDCRGCGSQWGGGVHVINITKDALEVEKLKKELGK